MMPHHEKRTFLYSGHSMHNYAYYQGNIRDTKAQKADHSHQTFLYSSIYQYDVIMDIMVCFVQSGYIQINCPVSHYSGISAALGIIIFIKIAYYQSIESYAGGLITHGIYTKSASMYQVSSFGWSVCLCFAESIHFLCVTFVANVLFWRYLERSLKSDLLNIRHTKTIIF
jgi:hypothetical protein